MAVESSCEAFPDTAVAFLDKLVETGRLHARPNRGMDRLQADGVRAVRLRGGGSHANECVVPAPDGSEAEGRRPGKRRRLVRFPGREVNAARLRLWKSRGTNKVLFDVVLKANDRTIPSNRHVAPRRFAACSMQLRVCLGQVDPRKEQGHPTKQALRAPWLSILRCCLPVCAGCCWQRKASSLRRASATQTLPAQTMRFRCPTLTARSWRRVLFCCPRGFPSVHLSSGCVYPCP
jgi:hypothetical protein